MTDEALRLADELEMWTLGEPAAAELRRLVAQRDALLEALQSIVCHEQGVQQYRLEKARAAIKQAEDFSPEAIRATQAAWKMGYDARKAEENT